MNWRGSGRLMMTIGCGLLLLGLPQSARAEMRASPAQVDSLVWYVEDLEHQLAVTKAHAKADSDSLRITLQFMGQRLSWALEDRPRWYEKPTLAFMAGAILAMIILGQVVKITF